MWTPKHHYFSTEQDLLQSLDPKHRWNRFARFLETEVWVNCHSQIFIDHLDILLAYDAENPERTCESCLEQLFIEFKFTEFMKSKGLSFICLSSEQSNQIRNGSELAKRLRESDLLSGRFFTLCVQSDSCSENSNDMYQIYSEHEEDLTLLMMHL